jgi:hypothetical protein
MRRYLQLVVSNLPMPVFLVDLWLFGWTVLFTFNQKGIGCGPKNTIATLDQRVIGCWSI